MEHTPDAYAAAFRQADDEVTALVRPLSHAQFNWKPAPEKWSVAECIDHLNTLGGGYLPMLEEAARATEPRGAPPYRYDWRGRLFLSGTTERVKLPIRTMKSMAPRPLPLDVADVLGTFQANTRRFLAVVDAMKGLDLGRIRLPSPFLPRLPFLTFPVGALIEGSATHEERHIRQAERVAAEPGFPAA